MIEVSVDDAAGVSLKFLSGTSIAMARVIATATVAPFQDGDHEFPAGKWHQVPRSGLKFTWSVSSNGFIEIDFRDGNRLKRLLYRKGKRPRVKSL